MEGSPAAFAALNATRANSTGLEAFMRDYAAGSLEETGESKLWSFPPGSTLNGTLDGWLLDNWFQDFELYDALFFENIANSLSVGPLSPQLLPRVQSGQSCTCQLPRTNLWGAGFLLATQCSPSPTAQTRTCRLVQGFLDGSAIAEKRIYDLEKLRSPT